MIFDIHTHASKVQFQETFFQGSLLVDSKISSDKLPFINAKEKVVADDFRFKRYIGETTIYLIYGQISSLSK